MNSLTSPEVISALVLLLCMAGAAGLLVSLAAGWLTFRKQPQVPTEDAPEWDIYKERV